MSPPCRLQHTVTLLQQQCEEHRLLLQTLRAELHVYESLPRPSAETRAGTGPASSVPSLSAQLLILGRLDPLQPFSSPKHLSCRGSRRDMVALLTGREGGQDPSSPPGTQPQLSAGPQALLVPGCFPSPPVRDVGTSSAAPLFSPLPSDTSVARKMDGGYRSLPYMYASGAAET